ncbi:transposase [Neoroseomonas alkaliterrae]|uniref:transposase n=1 Tax=Neoroseomonas alkaliterrae TaxID=1452450 RepID=UPI0030B9EB65
MSSLIDWQPVCALLATLYPSAKGQPAWPPLSMFKALLLAVWHDLSDVKLAEALEDGATFCRFCGFAARSLPIISSAPCRFLAIAPSSFGPKRTCVPDHSEGAGSALQTHRMILASRPIRSGGSGASPRARLWRLRRAKRSRAPRHPRPIPTRSRSTARPPCQTARRST